jgi:HlyD family secretion protein
MSLIPASALCISLIAISSATAAEITVEPKPFTIERSLAATALPTESSLLKIQAETLPALEIKSIVDHGSRVKAGQVLVEFDTEMIDHKLDDGRRALDSAALSLGQAEIELKSLKDSAPLKLDATKRAARDATEALAYFITTDRQIKEQRAEQMLKRYQQSLEGEKEELRQLEKMYKADDLTEETEEIILKRQHDSVTAAEFSLKSEELDHKRTLEIEIPHLLEEFEATAKSSTLSLAKAETEIPRQISLKEIELVTTRTALDRQKEDFSKLTADRNRINPIKAAADGWFYHGAIEDGRWTTGDAVKALVPTGQIAAKRAFATFIPATSPLALVAFTDEATATSLPLDSSGIALAPGREDLLITAKVGAIAAAPGTDGRYRIDLTTTWPADALPAPGTSAQVRFISYENPAALAVPTSALHNAKDGWSVTVKLADGKTGPHPVKRGRVSGDLIEILSGLETGQVIITP